MIDNPTRAAWAATLSAFITIAGQASAEESPRASATEETPAGTAEAPPTDTSDEPPPDWLIGAGIQTMAFSYGLGSLAGNAGGGAVSGGVVPFLYSVGAERRLSESVWLFANVAASVNHDERGGDLPAESSAFYADATLGVRPVVNPEDRIQLSFPIGVSGSLSGTDFDYTTRDDTTGAILAESSRDRGWSVEAQAGLAVDFWVTRQVAVRLNSNILAVGRSHWGRDGDSANSWFAGLRMQPSVALMVGF